MAKTTSIAFERRYSDDSGVEYAVRFKSHPAPVVEIERINCIDFPIEEIDWLIRCLQRVKFECGNVGNEESQ